MRIVGLVLVSFSFELLANLKQDFCKWPLVVDSPGSLEIDGQGGSCSGCWVCWQWRAQKPRSGMAALLQLPTSNVNDSSHCTCTTP